LAVRVRGAAPFARRLGVRRHPVRDHSVRCARLAFHARSICRISAG
jgi:hypothetical protein